MLTIEDVRTFNQRRLENLRNKIEKIGISERESDELRGRIAEQKQLQAALKNETPPAWSNAAE